MSETRKKEKGATRNYTELSYQRKVGGTQVYTVKVTFMLLERLVVLPGKVVSIRKKTSSFKLQ